MPELPALALIEYASIALGTRALDSLLKKATVTLLRAGSVQPGKFAILFAGQVGAAEESYRDACRIGAESLVDHVLLPEVHDSVYAAVLGKRGNWTNDTLGIIETPTMAAVLDAADAAVKGASVEIVELRLGDGLGGKGLAHFAGLQADMEAAIAIGSQRLAPRGQPICTAIIPRADETMLSTRGKSTRFGEGW